MGRINAMKICGYSTQILSLGCSQGQEAYHRLQGACLEHGMPVLLFHDFAFMYESSVF